MTCAGRMKNEVWNRTDCCGEALSNFYVFVSDDPFISNTVAGTQSQAGVSTYTVAGQAGTPSTVSVNRTGRYVRVQLGIYERLSVAEVQVFGPGGDGQVRWLVSDQLGTLRMIFDQTGALTNMQRHDYLPFGEELFAPTGGRTVAMGYAGGDGLREQFTSKERDVETGLDYFLARFYSSVGLRIQMNSLGGPDELYVIGNRDETKQALPYAQMTKPQSINKYQYCYNNPLSYVDPDGHDALYVVDKDKGTTTIVIPVHFTGANATPGLIAEVTKRASELDTGDSGVKIQIVSTDKPIEGVLNTMDLSQGKDFKNYWAGEGVNRVGGNKGHIDTNGVGQGGAVVHETLHFAGLKDRYQETTKDPKKGRGKATPDKGYDNANIMAANGGTTLKPGQIKEARQNGSTKKCSVENGSMKCK